MKKKNCWPYYVGPFDLSCITSEYKKKTYPRHFVEQKPTAIKIWWQNEYVNFCPKRKVAIALCLLVSSGCRCVWHEFLLRISFHKSSFWHVHHAWESIEKRWLQHQYDFFPFGSLVSLKRDFRVWMSKRVFLIVFIKFLYLFPHNSILSNFFRLYMTDGCHLNT